MRVSTLFEKRDIKLPQRVGPDINGRFRGNPVYFVPGLGGHQLELKRGLNLLGPVRLYICSTLWSNWALLRRGTQRETWGGDAEKS